MSSCRGTYILDSALGAYLWAQMRARLRAPWRQLKSGFLNIVELVILYFNRLFIFLHPSQNCTLNESWDSVFLALIVPGTQYTSNKHVLNKMKSYSTLYFLLIHIFALWPWYFFSKIKHVKVTHNPWFIISGSINTSFPFLIFSNWTSIPLWQRPWRMHHCNPPKSPAQSSVLQAK